jgi:hypothetical protein
MAMALLLATTAELAAGHGAMTFPRPRNAYDGALPPWSDWHFPCNTGEAENPNCTITGVVGVDAKHFAEIGGACSISAHSGVKGALNASNGQSCYWFSNGCTVGCDACDGTTSHVGHGGQTFLWKGMDVGTLREKNITIPNPFSPPPGEMVMDPKSTTGISITPGCAPGAQNGQNATICARSLRSVNTEAECGSAADYTLYSPWRHPGAAPMIDPCGSAGGRLPGMPTGGAGAQYRNTSLAKTGDLGTKLPPMPAQAVWRAGVAYEAGWTVAANHGGGYAYRMAPLDSALTEQDFQKMPLEFVGHSILRWDGDQSTQLEFNSSERGWETNQGTVPRGSTWRKNPIPVGLWSREGSTFEPVCAESQACIDSYTLHPGGLSYGLCKCSGLGLSLSSSLEVVDRVLVPKGTAPGKYVLQWRWVR